MKLRLTLVALAAVTLFAASAGADATLVRKYFGAASISDVNLFGAGGAGQTVSVDLTGPARKKKILVVNATATQDAGASLQTVSLLVNANGIRLEPGILSHRCERNTCTVSSSFFLSMEDAELANPGSFYNKLPMTVEVRGVSNTNGIGKVSMTADLIRR